MAPDMTPNEWANAAAIARLRRMYDGPDGRMIPPELTENSRARQRYCETFTDEDDARLIYAEDPQPNGRIRCYFRKPRCREGSMPCFVAW